MCLSSHMFSALFVTELFSGIVFFSVILLSIKSPVALAAFWIGFLKRVLKHL